MEQDKDKKTNKEAEFNIDSKLEKLEIAEEIKNISKSNPKAQLSPEQLKQFMAMMQNKPASTKGQKFTMVLLNYLGKGLQSSISAIDSFIRFITKKNDESRNDVVQSARGPILFGTYVILIFVVIGGLWAGFAPLDSAQVAIGKVIPVSQRQIVTHQTGGIIKSVFFNTGDSVKKGQVIMELDPINAETNYESALGAYRSYLANLNRVEAEHFGYEEIIFDEFLLKDKDLPEVKRIIETQKDLFKTNMSVLVSTVEHLDKKHEQLIKGIKSLDEKKKSIQKNLEVMEDKLKSSKNLFNKNFLSRAQLLDAEAKFIEAQTHLTNVDIEKSRYEEELLADDAAKITKVSENKSKTLNDMHRYQAETFKAKEMYIAAKDNLNKIDIRSPVDGTIIQMNYYTKGSFIQGAHPIAEIAPADDKLIIEAKIPAKNIDKVDVGLDVKVRFSAFKSRTTPVFNGKIIALSDDVVRDQEAMRMFEKPQEAGEGFFYNAKIEIDMEDFNKVAKERGLKLKQGMQVEIQIVTGTRTLLKYLLDPVTDNMFKAFKEK